MKDLTHLSLFTGIGGIDLAAEWVGFTTVGQCEISDYPYKVLCKHWPNVPKWRDIKDVTIESIRREGIENITLLSGGFPCQPFSTSGKRGGKSDDRFLWPEMFRVIQELKPTWIVGENVAGFVSMALDQTLVNLESEGYTTTTFIIPACGVGAYHKRDRCFVVAHSKYNGLYGTKESESTRTRNGVPERESRTEQPTRSDYDTVGETVVAHDECSNQSQCGTAGRVGGFGKSVPRGFNVPGTTTPIVCGRNDGILNRMDRIKCLGNAVVPQQVYPIMKAIYDIEIGLIQ